MRSGIEKIVVNIIDTHNDFETVERFTSVGGVVLNYSGSEDRFDTLMSSKLNFALLNETAEDGRYLDLLTGEERRFLIEVRNMTSKLSVFDPTLPVVLDLDANLIWRGFLLPDVYSEPYDNVSFFVNFTATDGLDILKTKPFLFHKTGTLIDYLAKCLWETGLNQQIYFAPAIHNAFYEWDKLQIFEECFTKYNENTDSFEYSNCYEVLDQLLRAVGATLFQHKGKWFVCGFNRRQTSFVNYIVYDAFGKKINSLFFLRNTIIPSFSDGLSVSIKSPFKTVQMNMEYKRSGVEVFPESMYKTDAYQESDLTWPGLKNIEPWNNWQNRAGSDINYDSEDATTYLRLNHESLDGSHFLHPDNEVPRSDKKPPFFLNVYNHFGRPTDLLKDYVELKPDRALYVSPQMEGKPLEFDFNFDLRVNGRVTEQRFNEDFYKQAFRIDVLLENTMIFSTRAETLIYRADDTKISYTAGQVGAPYLWYTPISMPNWKYSLERHWSPNGLKGEVERKGVKTSDFGKLNFRIYTPRNGDNAFGDDDFHANSVTVVKLGIEVKTWDNERYQVMREIRYTTKYDANLSFSDGKNDLYDNLFKINDRNDYFATVNTDTVYSSTNPVVQDNLYYYFLIPGTIVGRVEEFYHTMRLHSGNQSVVASLIFGKLAAESGIEIKAGQLRISKARIDEFPPYRELLHSIDKITVGRIKLLSSDLFQNDVPREKYINWRRNGSTETLRYLETYGRMIHECQPAMTTVLAGTALDIITPMDLVKFNWMGEKDFIPVNVSIDFSQGKTNVTLSEAKFQNLTDYGTT